MISTPSIPQPQVNWCSTVSWQRLTSSKSHGEEHKKGNYRTKFPHCTILPSSNHCWDFMSWRFHPTIVPNICLPEVCVISFYIHFFFMMSYSNALQSLTMGHVKESYFPFYHLPFCIVNGMSACTERNQFFHIVLFCIYTIYAFRLL